MEIQHWSHRPSNSVRGAERSWRRIEVDADFWGCGRYSGGNKTVCSRVERLGKEDGLSLRFILQSQAEHSGKWLVESTSSQQST